MKKKTWIREGDVVIVVPWEFQNEKADVIWKYTRPQVDWLERKGYLKGYFERKTNQNIYQLVRANIGIEYAL